MRSIVSKVLFSGLVLAAFVAFIPFANAAAPSATNLSAAETYTEDTTLNLIDIVVTDGDSATTTATLTLSNPAAGSLTTATSGAVTSTYVAGTGVWTAAGAIADVNVLLAGVSFVPALNFNASFTIATSVTDGVGTVTGTKAVTGVAVNDAPTATNLSAAESYTEDTSLNLIDIVVSDVDSASVTATLTLSNTAAGSLTTGTSGAVTSTYVAGTGVWTASGALANVNVLLAGVTFVPASNYNGAFTIATSVSDGVAAPVTGSKAVTGIAVNDPPTATNLSAAETYTEDTTLNLVDIVVGDVDSANVTVTLTLSNLSAGSLTTGTSGAVTSTFSNGVWTAAGAVASVNTLLASVSFVPVANFNGTFTIATSVSDGVAPALTGTKAVTGTPVNDAPVLDSSKSPALTSLAQSGAAPTGAVGTLVSALADSADVLGGLDNITDVDSVSVGVAIVGYDSVNLTCYYSTNGGSVWTLLGAVSATSARLLAADADNRIYCNSGAAGTYATALTIRAWDLTSGADGGVASTAANGGSTAYSVATDTVSLAVTTAAAPTGFTSGSYLDVGLTGEIDRLTVVVNNGPLTTCTVSGTELASDWTYSGGTFGGAIASATCDTASATVTFVIAGSSDHITGAGTAPTIAYNNTDGDNSIANATGALGTVTAFSLTDGAVPQLWEGTPVSSPTNDNTPSYSFFATEQVTLTFGGGCTSATTTAYASAPNSITFSALADGTYAACTIQATDGAGNASSVLTVSSFTVDTAAPVTSALNGTLSGITLTVTWTTDEQASSLVSYGVNGAVNNATPLSDVVTRVTSHTVVVTIADRCAAYTIQSTSTDLAGNTGLSAITTVPVQPCGGGLPVGAAVAPVAPNGGWNVSVSRMGDKLLIRSHAGSDVRTIALSSTEDFTGVGQLPYTDTVEWGAGMPGYVPTSGKVYIKFYTAWGQASDVMVLNVGSGTLSRRTQLLLDGGTVYLVIGGSKYGFATMATLTGLGYSPRKVQKNSTANFAAGGVLKTARDAHPMGSWVEQKGTVYFVSGQGLIPVPTWAAFLANGGVASYIVPANAADLVKTVLPLMTVDDSRTVF